MEISCEKPKIIVHPNLAEYICRYHSYYLDGQRYFYKYNYRGLTLFNFVPFYQLLPKVTVDTIDNYFVCDERTGETYPIFLAVPCCHCNLCEDTKANAFVSRCRLESQCYDCQPYFFTLTYDNAHLPADGASVTDIQKFMKRLRINLYRNGFFYPIRYCICAEYGPTTHRIHYHGIIWNLQPTVICDYTRIKSIFQSSWGNGEVRRPRYVDPSNDKCFYYTTKYMSKSCSVPPNKNKVFMLASRGNGGIGAHYLDGIKKEFRRCLTPNFKFNDKFSGRTSSLMMCSYTLNRLLPSFCRSIPSELRVSVRKFMQSYAEAYMRDPAITEMLYKDDYERIKSKFQNAFYFGEIQGCEHHIDPRTDGQLFGVLSECRKKLKKYFDNPPDFSEAAKVQRQRDLFIGRLVKSTTRKPLSLRIYKATQHRERLKSTSVL